MIGNDGGLDISYDQGKTWDFISTMATGLAYVVTADNEHPYNVYTGLQDNNSWGGPSSKRGRGGITNMDWFGICGGDGFYTGVNVDHPNFIFCESQDGNTQRYDLNTGQTVSIRPSAGPGVQLAGGAAGGGANSNAACVDGRAPGAGRGGGGGGGGPIDSPPTVNLTFPQGGEKLTVGNVVRILWNSSDDKGIQSQRIDFSTDGSTYNTIGAVDGKARSFDWRIPSVPTPFGRIKITALDGVNLPVSSVNAQAFEVVNGPPDNLPPQVLLVSPNTKTTVGGGQTLRINWKETDNVGVIQRVIELSTDGGNNYLQIISLLAPSSGENQTYDWLVPIDMFSEKARVRVTVYDGSGNNATVTSGGNFDIWPLPIITGVDYNDGDKPELEISGRNFRNDNTKIFVDGKDLKKVFYEDKFKEGNGSSRKVFSKDKKIKKRVPLHEDVVIEVMPKTTNQMSPPFTFRRRRPN
jgi:hypothetical protein